MTDLTPPTSEAEALDWLRLIRSPRIGPITFRRMLDQHGTAAAALDALPAIAADSGTADYQPCPTDAAAREYAAGVKIGARLLALGSRAYPAALSDIGDAPPLLWAIGSLGLLHRPAVAIVGARNASALGCRTARLLAEGLGQAGLAVVSGLARGIDAAAHHAALPTGTVGVLAGGVDRPSPPETLDLARRIAAEGVLLSEQPMGMAPQARLFPRRNRLVSGLSRAVIVVEAATGSGSLLTARDALDQGREVLAVPAHPFDARAGGCLQLLRDGATLVRGPEDVLAVLGPGTRRPSDTPPRLESSPPDVRPGRGAQTDDTALQARILERLSVSPAPETVLQRDLALPLGRLAPQLTELELAGAIERQPGGLLARCA